MVLKQRNLVGLTVEMMENTVMLVWWRSLQHLQHRPTFFIGAPGFDGVLDYLGTTEEIYIASISLAE